MILGIIYLIVAEKLAEWIKMGYGLYEFYRFTQYIYKMQTTPNKVIINKL